MKAMVKAGFLLGLAGLCSAGLLAEQKTEQKEAPTSQQAPPPKEAGQVTYTVWPIGWVRKKADKTYLEIDKKYQPGLLGVEELSEIWVLYWFDRNDTPQKRSILQVHPKGDPNNPIRGVFATRAPVRPNLIALSRCKIRSVKENIIEIDQIDAFPDTPILDLKP
jgi:tRNA-Thr(GGU) m(6)t(6)A37 methyltransferase TsaA